MTYLGSDVVWRSAECFRRLVALNVFLAHSEVRNFDVPVLIQQHVVQLQITVDDAARVQEKQPDRDFGRVEPLRLEKRVAIKVMNGKHV